MSQLVRVENFAPTRISAESRRDRVVYQSRNSKDKTSFVASSSPNSPHAAQLAQIALAVQSGKKERRRAPSRGFLSAPISYFQRQIGIAPELERPRQLLASGETYQEPPQKAYRYPEAVESDEEWNSTEPDPHPTRAELVSSTRPPVPEPQQPTHHYPSRDSGFDPFTTAAPVVTTVQYRAPSNKAVTHVQQPQVTRLCSEERVSYTVRGANGKLCVSAPAGTNEAQMFDEVARLGSEQKKERTSERRLVADRRRHRDRGRRSSR
ncbi:hypothetical protein BGZ60DRAFT_528964 [Tricladium varicosporioides]|nr:hypothetical protein BGZ60DRAFT_528964 [Hymenoscyphus varicosporioides]